MREDTFTLLRFLAFRSQGSCGKSRRGALTVSSAPSWPPLLYMGFAGRAPPWPPVPWVPLASPASQFPFCFFNQC